MTPEEEVSDYIKRAVKLLNSAPPISGIGFQPQQMQTLVVALMLQLAEKRGFR